MSTTDLLTQRLSNQYLTHPIETMPAELVSWFGAVQAQDYSGAKWAVGQRLPHATDATLEVAFSKGEILRTHVMRPTWHFVHPSDIRWLLTLTAPRVSQMMASYNKKLELTPKVFTKAQKLFVHLLQNKNYLTRQELKTELESIGVKTNIQRLAHIVMQAELDQVICSGPRRGVNFTYALLDERVPQVKVLNPDESLAELTKRYFQSHGPATIKDFVWWSGLLTTDAQKGIALNKPKLLSETIDKNVYWFFPTTPHPMPSTTYLLPNYDEYGIAYKDRSAFFNPDHTKHLGIRGNANFQHMIVYQGKIIGTWKKTNNKESASISHQFFIKPTAEIWEEYQQALKRYGEFLKIPIFLAQN